MRVLAPLWLLARSALLAVLFFAAGSAWFLYQSDTSAGAGFALLEELTGGAIRAGSAQGALKGPLTLRDFVYEDGFVRVAVAQARLDWDAPSLLRRQLRVHTLDAGAVTLTIKSRPPEPDPQPALTRLPLALAIEQAQVESFSLIVGEAAPVIFEDIELSASWLLDEIRIEALRAHYAPVGTLDLAGVLEMQPQALALRELAVRGLGEANIQGLIAYDGRVEAAVGWKDLRWPQQGEPLLRSAQGQAQIEGRWEDFAYRLQGDAEIETVSGLVRSTGRGSVEGLRFEKLTAEALGGTLDAAGTLRWLPALSLEGSGRFAGLDPQRLAPEWPGRLAGTFSGRVQSFEPLAGELQLRLRDSILRGWPVQLTAEAEADDQRVSLRHLQLRSGASELQARGKLWPRIDAEASLVSAHLGELWPGLSGNARARVELRGTRAAPHVKADAQLRALGYGELSVSDAELQMELSPNAPSRFRLELRDARAGVKVERVTLTGSGTVARNRFVLETRSAVGSIDMNFVGALDLAALRWRGQLTAGFGEPLQLSRWTLEEAAHLAFGLTDLRLEPACWRSANGRACVQSRLDAAERRVAFRVENLAFAYFEGLLPPGWKLAGDLSGTARLVQRQNRLEAQTDLATSAGSIAIGGKEALRFAPSRWLAEETAQGFVSRVELPVEDSGAGAGLYWNALLSPAAAWDARRWSGELRVELSSLQALRLLSPELESISGRLTGRFAISGAAGAPRLDGAMRLAEGSLRLATPGIELTGVSAELIAPPGGAPLRFAGRALSGGGELRVTGSADASRWGESLTLELAGENFQAAATPQAQIWVSPRLKFTLDKTRADLSGEVLVPRAVIALQSINRGIGPSADQVLIGPDGEASGGGLLQVHSNVRVVLGDAVSFDGLGLSTQLTGGLRAYDEPGRPTTALGEVRLVGGRYTAYGQDLRIETGRLLFNGGPITEPAVDIRAERELTETVTVGLYVRGQLDAPEFSLYSTPAMTQEQQLSWLVLGRPLQEEGIAGSTSNADRNALSGAALSLGLSGGNFLAQKLAGGLPIDEISIGAKPGQSSEQAKLTFGKYLSPKLFVSYGVGLFEPGQVFRLLYDIGRGFKLSTESGVESGGDIVYTIEK